MVADSLRVLLVDDDESFLSVTEAFLSRSDVDVAAESDPERALDRVVGEEFDCVVSDYEMPGMDGLEFLAAVRDVDDDLPFVLLTGAGSEDVASEAISLGATEYVQKQPGRGQFDILVNTVVNAAEAYRTERLLDESEAFVENAIESVQDVFYVCDVDGRPTHWNSRLNAVTGLSDAEMEREGISAVIPAAQQDAVEAAFAEAVSSGSARIDVDVETPSGRVPYELTFSPITDGSGEVTHVATLGRDVSERVERERAVTTLHDTTRALMSAESEAELYRIALDAADDLLGLPAAAMYRWDDDERALVPAAATEETRALFGELPVFEDGESIAFDVFVEGETRVVADVSSHENAYNPETVVASELFVPVGSYGLLVSGSRTAETFDDVNLATVEILAENTASALDRHAQEAALREQERELAAKTERLAEANRTNTLVRRIQSELVRASSRSDVEEAVCESLCADGPYVFAWVGGVDDGKVSPRTWAGDGEVLLDELEAAETPAVRAVREGRPVVEADLVAAAGTGWRRRALTTGAGSAAWFPLSFGGESYGVLCVYGESGDQFAGEERDILAELAATMANALNAVERKEALVSGGDVELEFRVDDPAGPVETVARRVGVALTLEEVLAQDDGSWLVYVSAPGDADVDDVVSTAESLVSVSRADAFDSDGERLLVGLVVTSFPCVDAMATYGASVKSFRAHPSHAEVVVTLPRTREVRPFVDAVADRIPGIELARRTRTDTGGGALFVDELTDKQRETLRTAYEHGFFAWPREHTGEEVADAMDVSAPTFHQHLRKALGRVLGDVFDETDAA